VTGNTVYRDSSKPDDRGDDTWIALWIHEINPDPKPSLAEDSSTEAVAVAVDDNVSVMIDHTVMSAYGSRVKMTRADTASASTTSTAGTKSGSSMRIATLDTSAKVEGIGKVTGIVIGGRGEWGTVVSTDTTTESLSVTGNTLTSRGGQRSYAMIARVDGESAVCNNRCTLDSESGQPAALIAAKAVIAGTNFATGGSRAKGSIAILPLGESRRVTVVGNITTDGITIGGSSISGTPWEPLNV
jgi:hypothetical protein